jgi:DNA-binding MarR family transcriptional regulator
MSGKAARQYADLPEPSTKRLRLAQDAAGRLLAVAERLQQHWAGHAAAAGLTPAQVRVLLRLRADEPVAMRTLAARLDYDASNLTTLVDRLEARGAVQRQSDPADRRVKALLLTRDGEELRDRFWRELVEDPGPLGSLTEHQLAALTRLLGAVDD